MIICGGTLALSIYSLEKLPLCPLPDRLLLNVRVHRSHRGIAHHTLFALKSFTISLAAFAPGIPVSPPPGCVPAPQR